MLKVKRLVVGILQTNCYIIWDESTKEGIIVDPGDDASKIIGVIHDNKVKVKIMIATHAHFDHILAVSDLKETIKSSFLIHHDDLPLLKGIKERAKRFFGIEFSPPEVDETVKEGDIIMIGNDEIKVLHTPGHSPGSISLLAKGFVVTGDTLFYESIGRTDLPEGDYDKIIASIKEKLFKLDDTTRVFPGHGSETTIGHEKRFNPYLSRA